MKTLELTVYPKMGSIYFDEQANCMWSTSMADGLAEEKRITDGELAAEYYAQDAKCRHEQWIETVRGDDDYEDWERAAQSRMYEQLTALHRFATLPNYDEESA